MLGCKPSDLDTYFDFRRFSDLLVDDGETALANAAAVDANVRAVRIVRTAESDICAACRAKDNYSLQELRDLVRNFHNGGIMGDQIVSLIAELVWARAIRRKRFAAGTPQGDDPAEKLGQDRLEQLKSGSRIFVLESVEQTDGNGNVIGMYGEDVPEAGDVSSAQLRSNVGQPIRLWGIERHNFPYTGGGDIGSEGYP